MLKYQLVLFSLLTAFYCKSQVVDLLTVEENNELSLMEFIEDSRKQLIAEIADFDLVRIDQLFRSLEEIENDENVALYPDEKWLKTPPRPLPAPVPWSRRMRRRQARRRDLWCR